MTPSVEEGKNAFLKVYTAEIKRDHPSWTFARCWQAAQAAHPELQETFSEPTYPLAPGTGKSPYPLAPGTPAQAQAKLEELLSRFIPKKVEADKPRSDDSDDGELMLVYGSSGEIVDIELT